ncbi:hypothetical protein IID62_09210, partial [candidate division KSB1 bacterium]|nr:hypothetical protein [candidate division KSB1 bacterium]
MNLEKYVNTYFEETHKIADLIDKNEIIKVKSEIMEGIHIHRLPYWVRLSYNT